MCPEASAAPGLSVIICTYNRAECLRDCLLSLSRQILPGSEYEVLVVDNNPEPSTAVQQIVQDSHSEGLFSRGVALRYLYCSPVGLSYARNAGVSAARGEICCFIDDDAVACADWLRQIASTFAAHPDAGVIGGHVILNVPEPRPKLLMDGLESYWSQFITPYAGYTEVAEWNLFPWGANWCARRKALLAIGGFRTDYGRKGSGYGGGEELVAAAQIQSLGYKIAILPDAKVLHNVEPGRFTLRHLWKTILSSTLVTYHARKDFDLPHSTCNRSRWLHEVVLSRKHPELTALKLAAHVVLAVHRLYDFFGERSRAAAG